MGYDDKTDCLCQKMDAAAAVIAGRYFNDYIACGQGFGQKNTLLAIWLAYTYLSPVISIAPSSYILFQNIVNSWQLWQRETGRL